METSDNVRSPRPWKYISTAIASGSALGCLWHRNFGTLRAPWAFQPPPTVMLYAALFGLMLAAAYRVARRSEINGSVWVVIAALSFGLGVAARAFRNAASDGALLRAAKVTDSQEDLDWYAKVTRAHQSEVTSLLVPRLALVHAERAGTIAAIDAFFAKYPSSAVQGEAVTVQRKIYAGALDKVIAEHSVTALRRFMADHPASPVDDAARAAVHELFVAAYDQFSARSKGADRDAMLSFVDARASDGKRPHHRLKARLRVGTVQLRHA